VKSDRDMAPRVVLSFWCAAQPCPSRSPTGASSRADNFCGLSTDNGCSSVCGCAVSAVGVVAASGDPPASAGAPGRRGSPQRHHRRPTPQHNSQHRRQRPRAGHSLYITTSRCGSPPGAYPAIPDPVAQSDWSTGLAQYARAATDCAAGISTRNPSLINRSAQELNAGAAALQSATTRIQTLNG
jgi:hypothetical protein